MRRIRLLAVTLLLSVLLAACNNEEESQENTENSQTEQTEQTEENQTQDDQEQAAEEQPEEAPVMEADEVVAVVNDKEILGEEFNLAYNQTEQIMQQYGQQGSSSEQLKDQTIQTLIDQELLRQDAVDKGIEVDEAEVEENLEEVKAQFENEEQYQTQLEQLNISEEMLRQQISYSILLGKYVDNELDVPEVTDEEVQAYYEQVAGEVEDAPALEEVEEEVRSQLSEQKEQEQVAKRVEELRAESEIETKV